MADGSLKNVYYNGFTQEELTGTRQGVDGLEALGVEHVKPIITRGILVDVAGYKGVPVLDSRYEVTMADVRGALAKQGISEDSIEPGDAILFNYGWAVQLEQPAEVQRQPLLRRRKPGIAGHRPRGGALARLEARLDGGRRQLLRAVAAAGHAGAAQRPPRAAV